VTVAAWRIVQRRYVRTAFSGDGARKYGGRWNSPGVRMVYTSANPGLATLEVLVHIEDEREFRRQYRAIPVTFPEGLVEVLDPTSLPRNWAADPPPESLRRFGDRWTKEARTAVLKVPSAVLPLDFNYLINPLHPDFHRLVIGQPQTFRFDPRLGR
jgi:RES domain-containing protein